MTNYLESGEFKDVSRARRFDNSTIDLYLQSKWNDRSTAKGTLRKSDLEEWAKWRPDIVTSQTKSSLVNDLHLWSDVSWERKNEPKLYLFSKIMRACFIIVCTIQYQRRVS